MRIEHIAIVGGGTAGWLAANHLGRALLARREAGDPVSITVIESPDIPIIGVGEGTVPTLRESLQGFGIDESDLFRCCDASFKQSIKFVNWRDKVAFSQPNMQENAFHHLFDSPSPFGKDLSDYWLQLAANTNMTRPYAEVVSPQYASCERNLAPKTVTSAPYKGAHGYAYHLDAAKFSRLLKDNAINKYAVKHLSDTVVEVELAPNEEGICALHTKQKGRLAFDFFVDCSGFTGLLMEKALKVPFESKAKALKMNKALVVQVPTDGQQPLPPYTLATAHQAGWIWDIALPDRRGIGLVYCDDYLSDVEAKTKLSHYLGTSDHQANYRSLPMRVGHLQKFWHKNCVALGLAQGFLEPLEATSILLTDFAASFLARKFPMTVDDMAPLQQRFNRVMDTAWQRVIDFIQLHYSLSDRQDSAFWRDNHASWLDKRALSDIVIERLALWQQFPPHPDDFFAQFEVFGVDNYLYLLYGMQFSTRNRIFTGSECSDSEGHVQKIRHATQFLQGKLPAHRALIEQIKQSGLA